MTIKEEKELKQTIARQFTTRPDKIEVLKVECNKDNLQLIKVKFKGLPYRVERKDGYISAVYRVI